MSRMDKTTGATLGAAFLFLSLTAIPVTLKSVGLRLPVVPRASAVIDVWGEIATVFSAGSQPLAASYLAALHLPELAVTDTASQLSEVVGEAEEVAAAPAEAEEVVPCANRASEPANARPVLPGRRHGNAPSVRHARLARLAVVVDGSPAGNQTLIDPIATAGAVRELTRSVAFDREMRALQRVRVAPMTLKADALQRVKAMKFLFGSPERQGFDGAVRLPIRIDSSDTAMPVVVILETTAF